MIELYKKIYFKKTNDVTIIFSTRATKFTYDLHVNSWYSTKFPTYSLHHATTPSHSPAYSISGELAPCIMFCVSLHYVFPLSVV
jgi:hypothetical protein